MAIAERLAIRVAGDPEMQEVGRDVSPEAVLDAIEAEHRE